MTVQKICVIGAANIDISGYAASSLVYGDSNIGHLNYAAGGVGRNIAENLTKLGIPVTLISMFGQDIFGQYLREDCRLKGIDISDSLVSDGITTPGFMSVLNNKNDLAVGIAAMDSFENPPEAYINKALKASRMHYWQVWETNLPQSVLWNLAEQTGESKIILDTVSGDKALRAKDILHKLYILKTNLSEAQILYGKKEENLDKLLDFFLEKGVQKVFITLGERGVLYGSSQNRGILPPLIVPVTNTTGAGDSFVAGVIYAEFKDWDIKKSARAGICCASLTLQSENAVSESINSEYINECSNKFYS
jgi:pseudouridine kinase